MLGARLLIIHLPTIGFYFLGRTGDFCSCVPLEESAVARLRDRGYVACVAGMEELDGPACVLTAEGRRRARRG